MGMATRQWTILYIITTVNFDLFSCSVLDVVLMQLFLIIYIRKMIYVYYLQVCLG